MDFTVTQKGLEEQLLGRVIGKEQKALEEQLSDVLEEVNSNTKVPVDPRGSPLSLAPHTLLQRSSLINIRWSKYRLHRFLYS